MKKSLFHTIMPHEMVVEMASMTDEEKGVWAFQFFLDLSADDPKKAHSQLAKDIIQATAKFRGRKSEAGKKGMARRYNEKQPKNNELPNSVITEPNTDITKGKVKGKVKGKDNGTNTLKPIVVSVISKLNILSGKSYKDNSKATVAIIEARIKDGFSEQDLLTVVENQCHAWIGTEQQQYLRPETLFQPKKIEGYLNNTPFVPTGGNGKKPSTKMAALNSLFGGYENENSNGSMAGKDDDLPLGTIDITPSRLLSE